MRTPVNALSRSLMPALLALIFGLAACGPTSDHHYSGRAYCDKTGCYTCDGEGHCTPVPNTPCTRDKDCASGEVCTTIGCAKPCQTTATCAPGEACVGGFCAPGNFSKVAPYSPPSGCQADDQCGSDEFCQAGQCKPRCQSDDQCGPGKVCTACGKCQPKSLPATCGTNQVYCSAKKPCGPGKVCYFGRCHFRCERDNICPVGQTCSDKGFCKDDVNPKSAECVLDMDCHGGACINGYCHDACTSSAQCDPASLCQVGICQPNYFPCK